MAAPVRERSGTAAQAVVGVTLRDGTITLLAPSMAGERCCPRGRRPNSIVWMAMRLD